MSAPRLSSMRRTVVGCLALAAVVGSIQVIAPAPADAARPKLTKNVVGAHFVDKRTPTTPTTTSPTSAPGTPSSSSAAPTSSLSPTPTSPTHTSSTSPTPTSRTSPTPTSATMTRTSSTSPASSSSPVVTAPSPSPVFVVSVSDSAELAAALSRAQPGQEIRLADGRYSGRFTLTRSGASSAPIRVTGSRAAVLDGGSPSSGYGLHLDTVHHVTISGITITNSQKAIVLDESTHVTLDSMDLGHTGAEVVLLRNFSTDNVVRNNVVHDSGLSTPGYGEGVYIGLAKSNWSSSRSRTGGAPDRSDRNVISGNRFTRIAAENVDIKEGTTGGQVIGNRFDATGLSGANYADSWVDVKGNSWLISGNTGTNGGTALLDGYQTHVVLTGWGQSNVFQGNVSTVDAPGYGFAIQGSSGNVVRSDNLTTGAAKGVANIPLT